MEVRHGTVTVGEYHGAWFRRNLADASAETSRRVILATGIDHRPPDLPGVPELWGRSVFHCPFCHGWEVRDQPLVVLADAERGLHAALPLRGWSDDVTLLTNGPSSLSATDHRQLTDGGVTVDERPVTALIAETGELAAITFADGTQLERRGLLVPAPLHQRSDLAAQLGATTAQATPVVADPVAVDPTFATSTPGVFAAGDMSTTFPQVAAAITAGSLAAVMVVQSLFAGRPRPAPRACAETHRPPLTVSDNAPAIRVRRISVDLPAARRRSRCSSSAS